MLLHAAVDREKRQRRFTASMFANLMNCHPLKKAVTVDDLLGLTKKVKPKSREAILREAQRRKRTYADYLKEHGLKG